MKIAESIKRRIWQPAFIGFAEQNGIFDNVVSFRNVQLYERTFLLISTGKLGSDLQVNVDGPNRAAWTKAYVMWAQNTFPE